MVRPELPQTSRPMFATPAEIVPKTILLLSTGVQPPCAVIGTALPSARASLLMMLTRLWTCQRAGPAHCALVVVKMPIMVA
jgi:hypothetical protein